MTLTYDTGLDGVKTNRRAKYLIHRSSHLTVIMRTHTVTHTQQLCVVAPNKWNILQSLD